jgi:hypothetical protein
MLGSQPVFDENNYDYWKKRMQIQFKALGRNLWRIVMEGYVILDPKNRSLMMIKMNNSMIEL